MATDIPAVDAPVSLPTSQAAPRRRVANMLMAIGRGIGSLRLTVTLFAMSIFLILVGTLAQVDKSMWEVLELYFRTWIARVDLQVFLPVSFFPNAPQVAGWFFFPGGWTLGGLLALNLLAAHLTRFQVQARGRRLWIGTAISLVAVLITLLIILGAHGESLQGQPLVPWPLLWQVIRVSCAGLWAASVVLLLRADRRRRIEFWALFTLCILLGAVTIGVIGFGDRVRLSDASLRILWQLMEGGLAGVLLLVGCALIFKQRGGIVVIHAGVALMMFGELLVSLTAVEETMLIGEGQSVGFARQSPYVELAIVDPSPADYDDVVVVPGSLLRPGARIQHADLPVDIEVLEYYQNARLDESPDRQRGNPATTGSGLRHVAVKARPAGGAEGEENIPAMYARFVPKDSPSQPQVYLCALELGEAHLFGRASQDVQEELAAGGKTYRAALRFKRNYKPYTIKLKDVRKEDYLGTDTPRDYSSFIILNDPSRSIVDQEQHIWMNNPLRYAGETFYQSSYHQLADGREFTTLAVVTNTGWMIPYVACMIVVVGMLAHFLGSLRRFVSRRLTEEERRHATAAPERLERGWWGIAGLGRRDLVTVGAVAAAFVVVLAMALTKRVAPNGLNLDAFGELPIMYEGRIKPIDTLARNKLRIVSDKETFYSQPPGEGGGRTRRLPAIKWLLDVITRSDEADHHPVFRIENLDVQEALGLLPRPRFRYALDEFHDRVEHFDQLAREAAALEAEDPAKLTHFQRKLLETHQRLRAYVQLRSAFQPIPFPPLPSRAEAERDPAAAEERLRKIAELALVTPRFNQELMRTHPPRSVPVGDDDATWLPYAVAANEAYLATNIHRQPAHENVLAWAAMLAAYDNQDAAKFNKAVADYRARLTNGDRLGINLDKISFEAFVNRFQPFNLAMILYLAAFVINALAWLGWYGRFRRAALTLIILTFALHTFALFARIYISGRPPVTNLYSSAVFIGWGGVLLCILLELVYGLSIGNAIAAAGGFATLVIAHGLAADGDTFTVLQAVLDTQFWLATHVVCVTLGYATTFVAGTLGVGYILGSVFTPKITKDVGRQLCRMIYGIVCFSLFFSFFGTVLGGLWADDSWGRFWGWDPKENGALIIVLWNALILHARWGGMVAERGLAVLAVLGNVTTVWSWFGVNELGVGLHSYGFTEGTLPRLALFVLCQLIIAAIGCLPLRMWWSRT